MSQKLQKPLIIITLLVLILIILISSGILLLNKNPEIMSSSNNPITQLLQKIQPSPSPTTKPTGPSEPFTGEWKDYKNEPFGFTFKYPATYIVKEYTQHVESMKLVFANPTDNQIVVEATTKYNPSDIETFQGKTISAGVSFPNSPLWNEFFLEGSPLEGSEYTLRAQTEVNHRMYSVTLKGTLVNNLSLLNSFVFTPKFVK